METPGIVPIVLPVHVLAGTLALGFGYVALGAAKGAALHRRSGALFVAAMVTMSLSGALVAVLNSSAVSVVAGLMTFYCVTTALVTVRPRRPWARAMDVAAMVGAVIVALLAFGFGAAGAARGSAQSMPLFIFGAVGLLAAAGDWRMIRADGIHGPRRIARHLWRMCFAMWVAAASFFWGPAGRVPEWLDIPALLPVPVLLPIVLMAYWLRRLRSGRALPVGVRAPATPFAAPRGANH